MERLQNNSFKSNLAIQYKVEGFLCPYVEEHV